MRFQDTGKTKKVGGALDLSTSNDFIHFYGAYNCRMLKMKKYDEVIAELSKDGISEELGDVKRNFIRSREGRNVLCYINGINNENPDIFVFGDNDIPFTLSCFNI